jgi:SAM-dependent methyltransferase
MTGVDISAGFVAEARGQAPSVEWVEGDMRKLPWTARFDAAYCWGNSFGYFDYSNCVRFLEAVARTLKPGGRFVLESGAVAETLLPVLQLERAMKFGDLDYSSKCVYDAADGRMDITYTFVQGERKEVKAIHQWVYSAAELRRMFAKAGLEPVAAFGGAGGEPFKLGSPRLVLVGRRYNGS